MDNQDITGHYIALAAAKRGEYPDGRTKLGKSLTTFRNWLRGPYGDSWNSLQEAREAIALPWIIFWLLCPMINTKGNLHAGFVQASAHLERTLKDIASLAGNPKAPNLDDYLKENYGSKTEGSK
jgi:hypothetical protein